MKATILIATRNRVGLLRHGLESILAMNYRDADVLVVDDGSEDETQAHCTELADKGLIRYHRMERDGLEGYRANPGAVWNVAHSLCESDIVIEQGGEVMHVTDCVTPLIAACEPGLSVLARTFNGELTDLPRIKEMPQVPDVEPDPTTIQTFAGRWPVPRVGGVELFCGQERQVPFMFCGALHRLDFEAAGGYSKDAPDGNDTTLARKLLANGIRYRWVGSAVALHLRHGKS
jgi:hypothetical protein